MACCSNNFTVWPAERPLLASTKLLIAALMHRADDINFCTATYNGHYWAVHISLKIFCVCVCVCVLCVCVCVCVCARARVYIIMSVWQACLIKLWNLSLQTVWLCDTNTLIAKQISKPTYSSPSEPDNAELQSRMLPTPAHFLCSRSRALSQNTRDAECES